MSQTFRLYAITTNPLKQSTTKQHIFLHLHAHSKLACSNPTNKFFFHNDQSNAAIPTLNFPHITTFTNRPVHTCTTRIHCHPLCLWHARTEPTIRQAFSPLKPNSSNLCHHFHTASLNSCFLSCAFSYPIFSLISCSHIILLHLIFFDYFKHFSTSLTNLTSFISVNQLYSCNIHPSRTITTSKIRNSITLTDNLSKTL